MNRIPFPPSRFISSVLETDGIDSSQLGINIGLQREDNISGSKVSPACKSPLKTKSFWQLSFISYVAGNQVDSTVPRKVTSVYYWFILLDVLLG